MPSKPSFSDGDLQQLRENGVPPEEALSQIERFERGFPFCRLDRPCTLGDGVLALSPGSGNASLPFFREAAGKGRIMKFVPASGAASRMFKSLQAAQDGGAAPSDNPAVQEFVTGLPSFAFFEDLKAALARDGFKLETLLREGGIEPVLDYTLTSRGLNLAGIPKGLIPFHAYPGHTRTPFEEHLVEAAAYACDAGGVARVHFTVSPEHHAAVRDHLASVRSRNEASGVRYIIDLSHQQTSTDTLAVDPNNRPFRKTDGGLLLRPGGHGALLENLNRLEGDVVFLKNIDNVAPDRLKADTILYKKYLAGLLLDLQSTLFSHLHKIAHGDLTNRDLEAISGFARERLHLSPGPERGREERIRSLFNRLNRPLRVCGMVPNAGEPGGGPFWVRGRNGELSLQIVESSQVDLDSPEQRAIWESSTHFNPVDLVCGVRDYLGKPFDLKRFRDPDTGFISKKTYEGRELKALELPGLWNGAMAFWNTVFVEVPLSTFSPVKTVFDLLRKEHQEV